MAPSGSIMSRAPGFFGAFSTAPSATNDSSPTTALYPGPSARSPWSPPSLRRSWGFSCRRQGHEFGERPLFQTRAR
jgi:hypothetical protein